MQKMGLNWMWTEKIGKCKYNNGWESTIYSGNAQMIAINHLENDTYTLAWFSADKNHLRNMLGLTKGYENVFKDFGIEEIELDVDYKQTPTIVNDLAKAKLDITIKLYKNKKEE